MSMSTVKRGVEGSIDGAPLRIRRPHFGWRRANRPVEISGPDVDLQTDYQASRRYRIRRGSTGEAVFERHGQQTFLNREASPAEVAVALAIARAGVVETSSLVNYITLP